MATHVLQESKRFSFSLWLERLGVGLPVAALAWSWILGNSMYLVYLPWAPYAMLALSVWAMVLLTRLFQGEDRWDFPGGKWGMGIVVVGALVSVVWMALFVVGLKILEFSIYPVILLLIYVCNQMLLAGTGRHLLVTSFIGALAFAYGCAVPVWYSAAIYNWVSFVFDARIIFIGLLFFIALTTNELWKRERYLLEHDILANQEDEDAKVFVLVSVPLLLLVGFCLIWAWKSGVDGVYGDTGVWVFYSIAICAGLIYVLNKMRYGFSLYQLRRFLFVVLVLPAIFQFLT